MRLDKHSFRNRCSLACLALATTAPVFCTSYAVMAENDDGTNTQCASNSFFNGVCLTPSYHTPPATAPSTTTVATSGPDVGLTHDADAPNKDFNQCAITSATTSAPCFGGGDVTGVHARGQSDGKFEIARLDAGVASSHAIDLYGICRYVDKSSAHGKNSILIPMMSHTAGQQTNNDWQSFTSVFTNPNYPNNPNWTASNDPDVHLDKCVRGGTVTPPANYGADGRTNSCSSPHLTTSAQNLPTLPYQRYASNIFKISGPVTYSCAYNDDPTKTFTETVVGTYAGGIAPDRPSASANAGLPTSWGISSIQTSFSGLCGTANNVAVRTAPTSALCHAGVPSSVTVSNNNFVWSCSGGSDGNNSASCSAPVIVDAVCGTANGNATSNQPTTNLCVDGSTPTLSATATGWTWTCEGTNNGNNATCSSNRTVNGACGASNGAITTVAPSGNFCNAGTASPVSGGGPWTWTCTGSYGGTTDNCSANLMAACGTANNLATLYAPTTNLCASGAPTPVTGSGPWVWSCTGSGGHNAACSAPQVATTNYVCTFNTGGETCNYDSNDVYYNLDEFSYTAQSTGGVNYNIVTTETYCASGGGYSYSCGCNPATNTTTSAIQSVTQPVISYPLDCSVLPCTTVAQVTFTPPKSWQLPAALQSYCTTTGNAINGVCGADNGTTKATTPTGLCSAGTPTTPTGSGPWNWQCGGINGGSTAYCSASSSIVNGACGSANGANFTSKPSSNLCSAGTASTPTGSGPWNWSCAGLNNGLTTYCSANLGASCGGSNGGNFSSAPGSNLCASGSASSVSGSGPWTWSCSTNNGSSVNCSANEIINGACGSANGTTVSYAPNSNLCSVGSADVFGSGPWTWSCAGKNGGTTASCSANLAPSPVNGVCGSANGTTVSSAPSSNLCSTGSASSLSGSGPWTWSCAGSNGGTTASCSASYAANISVTRGQLHWDGNWTADNFWCDTGYTLVSLHYDQGGTNNATWYECQGQVPASVVQSGNIPVVGILHWDGAWQGDHFTCDPGYNLVHFHYDCGCDNNADWYECQGTVSPNNYTPLAGPTHWDGNWTADHFWCDAPFTATSLHYDCTCTNNATWTSCQISPTAGACGTSNGVYSAGRPSTGLCSAGSPSSVSGNNAPYTWTCSGTYGGATANCATNACPDGYTLSNGACVQQVCSFAYNACCGYQVGCDYDSCGNVMDTYSDPGCS